MKTTGFEETVSALYKRLDKLTYFQDLDVSADPPAAFFTIEVMANISKDIAEVRDEIKSTLEQWVDVDCKAQNGYIVKAHYPSSFIELRTFVSGSDEQIYKAEFVSLLTYSPVSDTEPIRADHSHPK